MPAPQNRLGLPNPGFGVGLRPCHFQDALGLRPGQVFEQTRAPDWFEVISENFMDDHGQARAVLHRIAERYRLVLHGVSLSIGSTDPLDEAYLQRLKRLCDEVAPLWVSDHLCWTGVAGMNRHDLLPLPLNEICLRHVIARVHHVQERLGRPLILENPSSYMQFTASDMPEWEFLNQLTASTGAGLLLDVNNVYVSGFNLGFDAGQYIDQITPERVVQVHLAGPTDCGSHLIDTHDQPVPDPVWQLYARLLQRTGPVATLLEWDANIPSFAALMQELDTARRVGQGELPPVRHSGIAGGASQLPAGSAAGTVRPAAAARVVSTPINFMLQEAP